MTIVQKMMGIILIPRKTLEILTEKPEFLGPLIITFLAPFILLIRYPALERSIRDEFIFETLENINYERAELLLKFSPLVFVFALSIFSVLLLFIGTLFYFAIIKIIGGEGSFIQYYSICGYANTISYLNYIAVILVSIFTGKIELFSKVTGIYLILPEFLKNSIVGDILNSFDIFSIWIYGVTAIGLIYVSKLNGKVIYTIIGVIVTLILITNGISGVL